MLEEYCNSLSDEAQLEIALRLGKMILPVWDNFFAENPSVIEKINSLIIDFNYVHGASKTIDLNFPTRALQKIERSFKKAADKNSSAIPQMKSDASLSVLLATSMQPLMNPKWDETLPYTVKLVFTMVFNIVTWILYRRKTEANETHVYVAINQAADILLSESILSVEQINGILAEYQNETRKPNEDSAWDNAPGVKKNTVLEKDEIYRKIIGEKIIKNACGIELAKEILRQMREENKSYRDEWEEYDSGTAETYSYNKDEKSFWCSRFDVIVGSFFDEYPIAEEQMLNYISGVCVIDLRNSGFEI